MNETQTLSLPLADDLHVHLRAGETMRMVAPLVRAGGVGRCVVMPNTAPPVRTAAQACAYREELLRAEPALDYLMTIYLSAETTTRDIEEAARAGAVGVKCYPRGVTTNSESGVEDLAAYRDVFAAMQANGLVLQLHGEAPSDPARDICCLNAEERFLPELARLHESFPGLRIVLEHVSSAPGVELVKRMGETVAATITPHHLVLTVDDWAGQNHHYCKPVAKFPRDRAAICRVVGEGHPRFFLGSDSAPHPRAHKEGATAHAGVFTSPVLLPLLAHRFEQLGCLERLRDFACTFGHRFYGLPAPRGSVTLARQPQVVPAAYGPVVPLLAGRTLNWRVAKTA